MKVKAVMLEIICALLIILFLYAAVTKVADVQKFRVQIGQSPLLTPFASVVSWGIPLTEILIAAALAIPRFRLIGFYASFGLMLAFTAYIIAILQYSDHIPCACGGVLQKMGWTEHLIFNIVFTLIAFVGIFICPAGMNEKSSKISDSPSIS